MSEQVALFLGRFAPFHNGHLYVLKRAMQKYDHVIMGVCGYNRSCDPKTPFSPYDRIWMIQNAIEGNFKVSYIYVNDYPDSDHEWATEIIKSLEFKMPKAKVTIIGAPKDTDTDYYLNYLSEVTGWPLDLIPYTTVNILPSSTLVRELLFHGSLKGEYVTDPFAFISYLVPPSTLKFLHSYINTSEYKLIVNWIEQNRALRSFQRAGEPIFVTTDAILRNIDRQILIIKRGGATGHGLWALPGGFAEPDLTLVENMRKELREEVGVDLKNQNPIHSWVEDKVDRSTRGRTITHVFVWEVGAPNVFRSNEALEFRWVSFKNFPKAQEWFEDHYFLAQKGLIYDNK